MLLMPFEYSRIKSPLIFPDSPKNLINRKFVRKPWLWG